MSYNLTSLLVRVSAHSSFNRYGLRPAYPLRLKPKKLPVYMV